MNFPRTQQAAAAALLCLMLAACGGGGGGGDNDPAALPATLSVSVPTSLDAGQALALSTNAQSAAGLSYAWDFGDGTTSVDAAPSHTWAAAGVYTVTVVVTNNAGEQRRVTASVTVGHLANVAGLVCSEPNAAGWCWQRPLPTGNPVNAVAMIDATAGWAVGEQGTLLKTADGGSTWQAVAGPSKAALADIAFADAQHGWALASDGSIWRTADGGATWRAVPLNIDNGDANATYGGRLRVIDANRVLAGSAATMIATDDGGLTWRRVALSPDVVTPNGTLFSTTGATGLLQRSTDFGTTATVVLDTSGSGGYYTNGSVASFADDRAGWYLGSRYDFTLGNITQQLWRSTDGGDSWAEVPTDLPSMTLYNAQTRFFGSTGWLWSTANGAIYRTTDGGAHWTQSAMAPVGSLTSAIALDAATLFVSGYGGASLSTDAGTTWQRLTPPDEPDDDYNTVPVFSRAGTAWLLQYGPRLYRSTDQGTTWQRVLGIAPTEANTALRSIWFTDATHGFAASDGGMLLSTSDGGRTWTTADVAVAGRTSSGPLQFVDAKNGWLLLGNDSIARTTDGGQSWSVSASSTPPADVTALQFLDTSRGWALGRNETGGVTGTLWSTADGGTHWEATPLPSTEYNALAFADANTGVLVGSNGRLARSTDGGKTWTNVSAGTNQSFYKVRFTSATEAWVVGSNGTLLRSTDAGATWKAFPKQMQAHFRDLRFADAKHGWVVGDGGAVLATRDGGTTWSVQASGTARDLHSVFAVDGFTAWIGGADGLVLSTAFGGTR